MITEQSNAALPEAKRISPIGPIGETAETRVAARDQTDSGRPAVRSSTSEGRFDQDSETPLLTPEEDAGDFQLFSETPKEAAKRDQAAEKAEADKMERAKAEARRNAPDLPLSGNEARLTADEAPQSGMKHPAGREALPERQHNAESKNGEVDPYARIRETKEGSAERVKAFMELPDGEHELGGKKFSKQGNTFQRDGQQLSAKGIEKSFRGVNISKKEKSDVSDRSDTSDKTETTPEGNTRQYSIAGEIGLRRLRWESKEALQRLENLELAKRLHKSGAKMDAIKFQTGWELGGDGKWRTELPDLKVKPGIDMILLAKKNPTLRDIVDAPEIFSAYSEVASTPVRIATFKNEAGEAMDRVAGAYDYGDDCFYISPEYVLKNEDEVNSVLTHEVQHKIQRIEGFAPGGNPEQFQGKSELLKEDVAAFRKKADASEKYRRFEQLDQDFQKFFVNGTDAEIDEWNKKHGGEYDALYDDPEVRKIEREKTEILRKFGNSIRILQVLKDPGNVKAWDEIEIDDRMFKRWQYRHLAGEVEARNAQTRMNMPLEQRLRKLLAATEDMAEKDKIYLEKAVGEALMMSPNAAAEEDSQRLGTARNFIEFDGKKVPIAEGIEFNADKNMQQVIYDYLVMLDGEKFHIAEDGIDVFIDENSAHEYTQSKNTRQLRAHYTDGFKAKMKAAAIIGSIIENANNGRDEMPKTGHITDRSKRIGKYRRYDIVFATPSGINDVRVFTGELTVWMDEQNGNTLRDMSNIKFNRKVREPTKLGRHAPAPADANVSAQLSGNHKITPDSEKVNPDSQKNPEKSSSDQSGKVFSLQSLRDSVQQKFSSGNTSLRQVAAGFRKINFQPGTVNLDLGGGKFDEGTQYLAEQGVTNLVFDPVNRDSSHNRKIFEAVKNGGVDTVTCNNVLNVIGEAGARDNVILQAAKALKPGGTAYFTVYEGDGSGRGRQSQSDAWQEHRKTADYLDEIQKHFGNVELKNKVIIASDPQIQGKISAWSMDSSFDNPVAYSLRKHRQVNPIVVNGQVQAEYADLLENKEYTPETISEWDQKAIAWIDRQGGIEPAAEMIANDTEHSDRHVATLVRRHVLNSEFAESLPADIRMAVELKNIDEGKAWGREGVARRLAALTLKNIDTVKALFRKLHENLSDPEKVKLRNKILDQTGVDINNLPPDLVNDKSKLDEVLRAELANRSNKFDKAYEYWINAILSAPTTHSANLIGNTANTLYELGPKRFAEAAVNTLAKRRDAATFGEFRESVCLTRISFRCGT